MKSWFPITLVLFATFFWGTTFIMVKEAISLLPVTYFLFLRFTLATVLTLPVVIARRNLNNPKLWKHGSILGILLFASYYFQTIGLLFTTPANAAFITGLNIIFIPFFGLILFNYRIIRLEVFAAMLSFTGTALLTINFANLTINLGDSIIILTAISIALHILFTEKYREHALIELLWVQFFTMSICAGILNLFEDEPTLIWYQSPKILFVLFVTVVLATIFAFGAQLYAQQAAISSTIIGVLFSMEPVFALTIDLVVGTIPPPLTFLGMTLIFIAILLATRASGISKNTTQIGEIIS